MATLADIILEESPFRTDAERAETAKVLDEAEKYVITDEVLGIVLELQNSSSPPYPSIPHTPMWLEVKVQDLRYGIFLHPGRMSVALFATKGRHDKWMTYGGHIVGPGLSVQLDYRSSIDNGGKVKLRPLESGELQDVGGELVENLMVCLALIQSPQITKAEPRRADPKLQKARVKNRKRPFVDFHEVVIHVNRSEREAERLANEHGTVREHAGRRLHFVRGFYRTKRGKVERVRSHWRGDASLGVSKVTHYRVEK